MAYSLVNMPAVGFDLCRLPGGEQIAEVLLDALRLGPDDLPGVARQHPGVAHRARWLQVERAAQRQGGLTTELRSIMDDPVFAPAAMLARLERSPIGSVTELERLLREEILDWTWIEFDGVRVQDPHARAAGDVLVEALGGAYAAPQLPAPFVAELRSPWAAAPKPSGTLSLGPAEADVRRVLDRLAALDDDGRAWLRAAVDAESDARNEWAAAVHDASWAIELTGRTRAAAAVQLLTVQAFHRGGLTLHDGASGVWNALSGLVHSLVVSDILGNDSAGSLQRFWFAAFGEDFTVSR
jgi:hypothetical protein